MSTLFLVLDAGFTDFVKPHVAHGPAHVDAVATQVYGSMQSFKFWQGQPGQPHVQVNVVVAHVMTSAESCEVVVIAGAAEVTDMGVDVDSGACESVVDVAGAA